MEQASINRGTPRLMIREMVLENFKSYAGAQSVGPFHKCFSSVVGPNGSGKSNVIDAMLFVFGKKAKQLRLNKVSELIHNSTHHQHLEQAKVSVYFEEIIDTDDEGYEVVPNSGFCVSRTARRDNSSAYYVDDKKSSFGEVTAMLKGKGIDLDNNRFLILQGEVEQISMMKPKSVGAHDTGLLEYLEDIIGTDKFVQPIEEQAKRLEEVSDARAAAVTKLKVVEKERDGMEDDKIAAESYLGKMRELAALRATVAQVKVALSKENLREIGARMEGFSRNLEHEQGKRDSMHAEVEAAEHKHAAASADFERVKGEADATNDEFQQYNQKDVALTETVKALKQRLKRAHDKAERAAKKAQASEEESRNLEAEIPVKQARIEELGQELQRHEQKVEQLAEGCKAKVEGFRAKLAGVRRELAPWEERMAAVRSRLDVAVAERDLLLNNQKQAQDKLQDAQDKLSAASKNAEEMTAQVAAMQVQIAERRQDAAAARAEEAAGSGEVSRLEAALREVRGTLQQRRADQGRTASQGQVVRALMDAKRSGKLQGLHGRLGDLGAIDAQYDVAASTAVGELDFIVADSTADAQSAVEFLRRGGHGVATFLILDKQRHLAGEMGRPVQPPEGVPRLFDLVRCSDERLRVAFWYAMRNTLVATDLDQASRIAYGSDKRWRRVVTLKGEMINESGTMTGGGGRPRGGRMCLGSAAPRPQVADEELAAELAAAERDASATQEALDAARAKVAAAGKAARDADKDAASLETQVLKVEMAARAEASKREDLQRRLASLKKATKVNADDAARLAELSTEVSATEAQLQELQAGAAGLVAQAEQLQHAMDNAGGAPLAAAKKAVVDTEQALSRLEGEVERAKVAVAAHAKGAAKVAKEIAGAQQEAEELGTRIKDAETQRKEMEDAAFKVYDAWQQALKLADAKKDEAQALRQEWEVMQQKVQKVVEVISNNAAQLESLRAARGREEAALKASGGELGKAQAEMKEYSEDGDLPPLLTEEEVREESEKLQDTQYRATILESELSGMSGINLEVIGRWRAKDGEYKEQLAALGEVDKTRAEARAAFEELRKRRLEAFMSGFNMISLKLKEMYQMITLGGDAELELVDSLDPFSEGIVFSVRPPKKSWKNITNLSGGEKTLSSLSLVFALHHYKPTPLYFMDEIDAALDFKNVSIVGHYIKERTKNAQFIIISLRNNMFELADRLVGIYKTDNCTKSVAINPGEFVVGPTATCGVPQGASERRGADENQPSNVITVT